MLPRPVLPSPPGDLSLEWVSGFRRAVVPNVPGQCDVEELWDELTLLRTGLRLAFAMLDDTSRDQHLVAGQLTALDERFSTISTRHLTVHPTMEFFAARALEDEERFGGAPGPKGIAIAIFQYMIQRWPVTIFATAQFQQRPVPLPQSPMHIVWISLAHSVGAIQLPMVPLVRYCGYPPCGKPIISTRVRKRGTRWFCDPEQTTSRSTCQNRFFAEQGRKRAKERGAANNA